MRTALVVVAPPSFDLLPGVVKRLEPVEVQALLAQRPVGLDEGVVGRLAGTAEVDTGVVMVRPEIHELPGELCAVVGKKIFRGAAPGGETIECRDDIGCPQAAADLDRESLAAEDIDHGERPEALTVIELVGDEIEAPGIVGLPPAASPCRG